MIGDIWRGLATTTANNTHDYTFHCVCIGSSLRDTVIWSEFFAPIIPVFMDVRRTLRVVYNGEVNQHIDIVDSVCEQMSIISITREDNHDYFSSAARSGKSTHKNLYLRKFQISRIKVELCKMRPCSPISVSLCHRKKIALPCRVLWPQTEPDVFLVF